MMRNAYCIGLAAALLALGTNSLRACGPDPRVTKMVRAVAGALPSQPDPERPRPSLLAIIYVEDDFYLHPQAKAAYPKLDASLGEKDWSEAIVTLTEQKATGCLVSGLYHPDLNVRLRCARALAETADLRDAGSLLALLPAMVPSHAGRADQALHGELQHAVADALNRATGAKVALKDGEDAEGIRAALPVWEAALQARKRELAQASETARQ